MKLRRTFIGVCLFWIGLLGGACGDADTQNPAENGEEGDPGKPPEEPSGSFLLEDGEYLYVIDAALEDTCWQPPKTNPQLPMDVPVTVEGEGDGTNFTMTPDPTVSMGLLPPFSVKKEGDSLTGVIDADIDLNSQGIDCILNLNGTFEGVLVEDNVFGATLGGEFTEVGGAYCAFLIGDLDPNQFDQLPCTLVVDGTATK